MSLSSPLQATGSRHEKNPAGKVTPSHEWIGIDFSGRKRPRRMRMLIPLLGFALVVALGIAALRIDLIRVRYALAAATKKEEALMNEQRMLIVRRRALRDPVELATQARDRGFRPPTRVLSLPDPVGGGEGAPSIGHDSFDRTLPDVAAAPPARREDVDWQ